MLSTPSASAACHAARSSSIGRGLRVQLDADAEAGHGVSSRSWRGQVSSERVMFGEQSRPTPVHRSRWRYMPRFGSIGAATPRAIESCANVDTSVPSCVNTAPEPKTRPLPA